jgi:hypothetical protein
LRSGKSNKKVTNPKQAIAIGLSEARDKGAKVPKKAASKTATKKSAPKKAAAKKAAPKKAVKKTAPKKATSKSATKKSAPKKAVKKAAPKKVASKKAVAPKKAAKKAASKKSAPKKVAPKKPVPLKKAKERDEDAMPVSEDVVGKAANIDKGNTNDDNKAPVEDTGIKPPVKIEDPMMAADQKAYAKATSKSDPRHNFQLSSAKSNIKPSGKKPLWRK